MRGNLPRRARWVAAGYVAGFAEGFCSHTYSLWTGGIHAFRLDPVPIQALFQAMLVLDALVAVLIIRMSRADVLRHPVRYLVPFGLLPITLFCVFVLVTAIPLHRAITTDRLAADQALEQLASR